MKKELVEISTAVENSEWYEALIEECRAIITETVFASRWALVEGWHKLGIRILEENDNFERSKIYGKEITKRVSESLNKGQRMIEKSIQFAKIFPDLDDVPDGKNISLRKIFNELLPEPKQARPELPKGKYNIIYADPAWKYWMGGDKNQSQHYECMDVEEIKKLPVSELAAENCILFMWTTFPILDQSFEVIKSWGFEYSTCGFVWVKSKQDRTGFAFGNGYWTRANAELCLIATKGKIERQDASISQIIYEPLEEHSKKPDIVREKIVKLVGDLPRIELFARQKAEGWDCWGNEL
jgi:N6-adenosine-specific RNA methylase IME4